MVTDESSARDLGLSQAEARRRLIQHGRNELPAARPVPLWQLLGRQFTSPLIYILLFALVMDVAIWAREGASGVPFESLAIGVILILNAGLGAYQESKAEAALARLKAMSQPNVWVLRDGMLSQIAAAHLVAGDVARLEAGDRVPADGRIVQSDGMLVDESVLTGESLPLDKTTRDDVFSGTLIVRGKAYVEVTGTGPNSTMGKLAALIGAIDTGKTPLERRLGMFGNQVAIGILGLGVILSIGGVMVEGWSHVDHIILFAVALAVAAVPEGLPAVLTLTLALGVERLANRKAIVRRLSAVEALGSVTVIATDKTGTLTENQMHVRAVETPEPRRALEAMALANDAERATRAGDPLELALLAHAAINGTDLQQLIRQRPRISSKPFDSTYKFMRVTVDENGRHISYVKGAPEVLIARSTLSERDKADWDAKALSYAGQGYRVLALAWRDGEGDEILTFLGLVMLWDPPRAEVPDALQRAQAAGIRVIMISGDHPATAQAVANVVGIRADRVLTGSDLETLSPGQLVAAIRDVNVFARVSPEHKLRLVEMLKSTGEVVAVTGDGVNDAPALKAADVGVAMGLRGSDVSREVSDVVLMDDNFATIVAAIEEGRSIYENIQKFVRFFFSTDLALIVLMIAGLGIAFVLGLRDPSTGTFLLPLTAVQLLWINVVADGPPALALAFDRNPDVMRHPPRSQTSGLLDAGSMRFIMISAAAKAAGGILLLGLMPHLGYSLDETRTSVFLYESLMQLVFVYPTRHVGLRPLHNLWIHVAVGLGIALQFMTVIIPGLRSFLQLAMMNVQTVAWVLIGVLLSWAAAEVVSRQKRR